MVIPRVRRNFLERWCCRPLACVRLIATLGMALGLWAPAQAAPSAVVKTPQVRAELVAHAPQGVAPGRPLWLGVRIEHQPHWHTYWKNPGDSGLPTVLNWTLPAGLKVGDMVWPTPQALPVGPLMNYGYEGTVLLSVPISVLTPLSGDKLQVGLQAQWLVCKEVCIPEEGEFALSLPLLAAYAPHTASFESAWARAPQPNARVTASAQVSPDGLQLRIEGLDAAWASQSLRFFPELPGVIDNAAPVQARWTQGAWQAQIPLSAQRTDSPTRLPGVLVASNASPGVQLDIAVSGVWPPGPAPTAVPSPGGAIAQPAAMPVASAARLAMALAFALVGGLLLNLMPCVFPVLSLKVLSFSQHPGQRKALLAQGVAYTAGVVLSFLVLAGVLLGLRAAGEQIGWGFQLQSPWVVVALCLLFTVLGLNLVGLFEVGLWVPSSWAGVQARHPTVDAALTGVLAVAVASPCTAPFMGASIGWALTWPTEQALLVFGALGLGMALPYLLASAWPAVARRLPRPGAWMLRFKQFMAFPMWATVVWLLWVLGQQVGIGAVAAVLSALLMTAWLTWVWHHSKDAAHGLVWRLAALAIWAGVWWWAAPSLQDNATSEPGRPSLAEPGAATWQPWSSQRVQEALSQGRPVFVDFTAAWCVTCQYNKRTTLANEQVLADFAAKRTVLLRADWTRRDAAITAELSRLQRSGVPVYALMAPGAASPLLLSEILTVSELRSAIARLP